MVSKSYWRGNAIVHDKAKDVWVYEDDGTPVRLDPDRPCGKCGRPVDENGHDACLGVLEGVVNACCGHGIDEEGYIVKENGERIVGKPCSEGRVVG